MSAEGESSEKQSHRGVPTMELIEDVSTWLAKEKMSPEEAEVVLREKYSKYKYVESSMNAQKAKYVEKLPEFKNSLEIIKILLEKKEKEEPFETTFLLSDDVYTKATVPKPEKVSVWLGANVMVEFELEKAQALLEKNQNTVQTMINDLTHELAFIKDQITTTEVNMAHLVNFVVAQKKAASAAAVKA
ncbi:unnamed protein product [Caenorhabditis bovis]|uniref:Prefoldin subunit 3 n=1 Tax=Caenorhabditis bovis TaxID=2654633 RepID=A0A8S1F3K5_9PELO|nr:unnamed protein product [Caenorhabditis bovis]